MDVGEFFLASRHQVYRAVLAVVGDDALATEAVVQAYAMALEEWRDAGPDADAPDAADRPDTVDEPDADDEADGDDEADADEPEAAEPDRLVWVLRRALGIGPRMRRRSADAGDAADQPLRRSLRRLHRRPRLAVALRLLAGATEAQAAAVLGRSPADVATDLAAGLGELRQELAPGASAGPDPADAWHSVDALDASYEFGVPHASWVRPRPTRPVLSDAAVSERVRAAFAEAELAVEYAEIERRARPPRPRGGWRAAGRGLRRRVAGLPRPAWLGPSVVWPVAAVFAAVVALALLSGLGRFLGLPFLAPGTWSDRAFAEACRDKWTSLAPGASRGVPAALPPPRFAFRDDELGLRLYADHQMLFACSRDESGQARGSVSGSPSGASYLPVGDAAVGYLAVLDLGGGPEYYLGRLPAGATQVVVSTTAGTELTAAVDGDLFAFWLPAGGLAGAQVRVYDGPREIAAGPPTVLRGGYPESAFGQACEARVLDRLARAEELTPALRHTVPPVRFHWREGDWTLWFYASDRVLLECELRPDGVVSVTGDWFRDPTMSWPSRPPLDYESTTGELGWAYGRAPENTEHIEVGLADGRVVLAQVSGGFFAAAWFNPVDETNGLAVITAYTDDTILTRPAGGTVTSRPR
ncbi:MAG: hypothetical protein ACM30G_14950 [Micromonosporaceae bacterium]